MKEAKEKTKQGSNEDEINKRIEVSKQLLSRLRSMKPPPPYATSLLESAIHNKSRVLEAHLSVMSDDARKF